MNKTRLESTWDETNFALFYQQHTSSLLNYLYTQTRTLEDAEDILLEVFLAARQNAQIAGETSRGQFAWLRQVAHNKMVDYYRRQGKARVFPLEQVGDFPATGTATDPEQIMLQTERLEKLQFALKRLPAAQQELLRLHFNEELRSSQIAARLGKRESAVRTMLMRTLRKLRGMYQTNWEEKN